MATDLCTADLVWWDSGGWKLSCSNRCSKSSSPGNPNTWISDKKFCPCVCWALRLLIQSDTPMDLTHPCRLWALNHRLSSLGSVREAPLHLVKTRQADWEPLEKQKSLALPLGYLPTWKWGARSQHPLSPILQLTIWPLVIFGKCREKEGLS